MKAVKDLDAWLDRVLVDIERQTEVVDVLLTKEEAWKKRKAWHLLPVLDKLRKLNLYPKRICRRPLHFNKQQQNQRAKWNRQCIQIVRKAIAAGELEPQPCIVCGKEGWGKEGGYAIEAHHHDYNKPLDVDWLCVRHHRFWHDHLTPYYKF